jgi:AraC family transcriptional regulator
LKSKPAHIELKELLMVLQRLTPEQSRFHVASSLRPASPVGHICSAPADGLGEERSWRFAIDNDSTSALGMDIVASRWLDSRTHWRRESAEVSSSRHVISLALKATRVRLARGSRAIFDGIMPAGMLRITGPSQMLTPEFRMPCDLVHLYVVNEYLRQRQEAILSNPSSWDMNDYMIRDALAGQLGRSLIDRHYAVGFYAKSVGGTIVMRLLSQLRPQQNVNPLSRWRLKRVLEYMDFNFAARVSLADLAKAAGLSPMHLALQFRAQRAAGHMNISSRRALTGQRRLFLVGISHSSRRLLALASRPKDVSRPCSSASRVRRRLAGDEALGISYRLLQQFGTPLPMSHLGARRRSLWMSAEAPWAPSSVTKRVPVCRARRHRRPRPYSQVCT